MTIQHVTRIGKGTPNLCCFGCARGITGESNPEKDRERGRAVEAFGIKLFRGMRVDDCCSAGGFNPRGEGGALWGIGTPTCGGRFAGKSMEKNIGPDEAAGSFNFEVDVCCSAGGFNPLGEGGALWGIGTPTCGGRFAGKSVEKNIGPAGAAGSFNFEVDVCCSAGGFNPLGEGGALWGGGTSTCGVGSCCTRFRGTSIGGGSVEKNMGTGPDEAARSCGVDA